MNKKQLIVAWIIAGIISFIMVLPPRYMVASVGYVHTRWPLEFFSPAGFVDWKRILSIVIPILILGILLIYTLKEKKK
jgi:uncharacterized membrane protein